uniref:Uncharacterized protein n=1 Tax=Oryza meridionalis TaxID=40149 RepID=A0A0E0C3X2_9ORYZ
MPNEKRKDVKSILIALSWEIWKERNSRVFRKIEAPSQGIIYRATEETWLWHAGGAKGLQCLLQNHHGSTTDNI